MNKSRFTTFLSFVLCIVGYYIQQPIILSAGLFAFSGAITNWFAIYMLFDKVPLLYGSGVIPAHFEDFKAAIRNMMMTEFFTQQNIDQFLQNDDQKQTIDLAPVINKIDLSPTFESLTEVIVQSSFGSMLNMFGGVQALQPLKQPFIEKMQQSIIEISQDEPMQQAIQDQLSTKVDDQKIQTKIEAIIDQRLNELTPELVKQILQEMIKEHLGWLVVWGGVFGGLLGIAATFLPLP